MTDAAPMPSFPCAALLRLGRQVAACLALMPLAAMAQPHEVREGGFVLRSSIVQSTAIDADTAQAHGIEPERRRGVLNVAVRGQDGRGPAVPAETSATLRDLAGIERSVALHEARAPNGWVSYAGEFEYAPREVLEVRVRARPREGGPTMQLRYRERMPVR